MAGCHHLAAVALEQMTLSKCCSAPTVQFALTVAFSAVGHVEKRQYWKAQVQTQNHGEVCIG